MRGPGIVQKARVRMQRSGLASTLHYLTVKSINSVVLLKILRGVSVERADPGFLKCPEPYAPAFLSERMIREFARDPLNEMPERFVEEALSRGDECFGLCDGKTLAAYGWYSFKPTPIDPPELLLHFSDEYVYMYKGFTHSRYRGQRLHAIGMTMALQHYLGIGYRGLVSYVESDNFDSLKSVFRMGYTAFGSVWVMKAFGLYLTHATSGCERFGFRVEPSAAPASRLKTSPTL